MKTISTFAAILIALSSASVVTPARADADDAAWIKKCVSDNKREGATAQVVAAYCACMNDKMSSSETLSITAWEQSHPEGNGGVRQGIRLEVIFEMGLRRREPSR